MKPEALRRILEPFKIRLANIATRSRVISVDSSEAIYVVLSAVRGKEDPEKIPMMQQFGFASVPPKDSDQIRVHLTSDPDNPLIIATHHSPSQPTDLSPGDAAMFDEHGQSIKMKVSGITIFSPDGDVNVQAPNGDVNVTSTNANVVALEEVNISTKTANITATTEVDITSPLAKFSGDVEVAGEVTATDFKVPSGITFTNFITHTHNLGILTTTAPNAGS